MKKIKIFLYTIFITCYSTVLHANVEFIFYDKFSHVNIFEQLDNLSWIPDGQENDNNVYVIAAPWCSASKKAYETSRNYISKVQLRWIMVGSRDATSLYKNQAFTYNRQSNNIGELFSNNNVRREKNIKSAIMHSANFETIEKINQAIEKKIGRPSYFPTIIFFDGKDWNFSNDIAQAVSLSKERKNSGNRKPLCIETINKIVKYTDRENKNYITKSATYLYSYPNTESIKIASVKTNFQLPLTKIIELEDKSMWGFVGLHAPAGSWANDLGGWVLLR